MTTTATIFAHDAWVFFIFSVVLFFAVAHGYYSRSGSAINQRPYHGASGDSPGARIPSTIGRDVDRRDFSRGTKH